MKTEILKLLEKDARLTPEQLSVMFDCDKKEIEEIIAEFEQNGTILGYNTVVDWEKTDVESVSAMIEVKLTPQRDKGFDRVAQKIYNYPEVKSVYLMSGAYDLSVLIEGKTMKEVAQFVARKLAPMDGVLSTSTHFVLKKYKESGTKLEQQKKDERLVVTA